MLAYVVGGVVREAPVIVQGNFKKEECYPAAYLADCIEVPAGVTPSPGWTYDGTFHAPAAPAPSNRVISSAQFLALFTASEQAALWGADPLLMSGALKVLTQGSANLDSAETASLLTLAVTKGALTDAERTRILAGTPPT